MKLTTASSAPLEAILFGLQILKASAEKHQPILFPRPTASGGVHWSFGAINLEPSSEACYNEDATA